MRDDFAAQRALSAHIRDPQQHAAPAGIEERRVKIYRELFFNNVEGLLGGNFPVLRSVLGDGWTTLIRDFLREHGARTPLFTELAREFLRYLETRAEAGRGDAPWLLELAHYEWIELALQISEASIADLAHDPAGDLLVQPPALSPLAWPLAYDWPVHRLGPDYLPDTPPAEPTLLLVRRDAAGRVSFHQLTALTFHLLQRIEDQPQLSGREQLLALAAEAGASDIDAFLGEGTAMLEALRADGTLLGTRLPPG